MLSITTVLQSKLSVWADQLTASLPSMLAALLVLIAFYLLAKLVRWLTRRSLARAGTPASVQSLIARLAAVFIFIFGLVIALSVLGLQKAVTTALAGAGVLGLVLGFAFQDVAGNFIAGIFLIFRKPFTTGDIVKISDHIGAVEEINLRATKLHILDGRMVYIPNREVFSGDIINYSELGRRRVEIECGVSYNDNLRTPHGQPETL